MTICYGVTNSILGRSWRLAGADDLTAQAIMQRHGLPDVLARILAARDIPVDGVDQFLNPSLRDLPDPYGLKDMEKGAGLIADAIESREIIGILGDYDVDGATSTSLMVHYIQAAGGKAVYHIPDRFKEGYGPSQLGLDRLVSLGAALIVTVDCGITANDLIDGMAQRVPVVIVDHHMPSAELPKANAVINPNRYDDDFPHKYLAAAGVTFFLLVAVNRILRERGFFKLTAEPDLKSYLDLVALGTVADIVPLKGMNRLLVRKGLEIMAGRKNLGLRALSDVARLDGRPDAYHLGFLLGPRINAAGRLKDSTLGVQLLTAAEEWQAVALAQQLDQLNAERQKLEETILQQAIAQVEEGQKDSPVLCIGDRNWHSGVIGIVASRIKDIYHRPVAVVAFMDGDTGTGSARSVHGFNLGNAILAAVQTGLLHKGGGHAMAAGFKIAYDQLPAFREFLNARFLSDTKDQDMQPSLTIDVCASLSALSTELVQRLNSLAPFGAANPQPRFAVDAVQLEYAEIMKEKHIRCRLKSLDGARLNAVSFRSVGTPLGQLLLNSKGAVVRVAGQLKHNTFGNKNEAQLLIEDAAA